MALTNFAALTTEQKTIWAMDLWKQARNFSFINKFMGKGTNSMIQHITELKKSEKGARAVITLLADLEGDGVAGDRTLEGNEEAMKSYDQVIRIDQLRHANRHEGRMADQKSIVEFRNNSRDVLAYWLGDRLDQLAFQTLAGISYAFKPNGAARVGSDLPSLEFAADVAAPTARRVLNWSTTTGLLTTSGTTAAVTANSVPTWKMIISLKAYMKDEYVRGIRAGGNSEFYNLFLTPKAMATLKKDDDYLNALRNAGARSTSSNELFTGDTVMVEGIKIHEFRHVPNTDGLASGSKYGGGGTIDGCQALMCGAQALGMADIGAPEWVEKGFDYENQQGISVQKIMGFLKPKFHSIYAGSVQDFGVVSVYLAI